MSKLFDDASLAMIPSAYKDGKLYSIRPTDGSGDFTFSRGSNLAATRVDVNGLIEKGRENVLLQSNNFTTTWGRANNTLVSGQSGYDGSNDAWLVTKIPASYVPLTQSVSVSGVNTFSFYAKAGTAAFVRTYIPSGNWVINFDFASGNATNQATTNGLVSYSMTSVGNGWYRCSTTHSGSITEVRIYNEWVETNASTYYLQDVQLEQGLVATDYIETGASTAQAGILEDMPRLDYSGSCPSLLLEPQRTNIITNSEYLGASSWVKSGNGTGSTPVITSNAAISPEGIQNATRVDLDLNGGTSSGDWSWVYQNFTSTGNDETFSMYVKAVDASNVGKVIAFGAVSFTAQSLTADWVRIEGTSSAAVGGYGNGFRLRGTEATSDTASFYVYGIQHEQNSSYPTSYIPTYGTSQTRSVDGGYTPTQDELTSYCVLVDLENLNDGGGSARFVDKTIADISTHGGIYLKSGAQIGYYSANSGYLSNSLNVADGARHKYLIRATNGLIEEFFDGTKQTDTGTNSTDKFDALRLLPSNQNASIHQLLVFPTALTDSECIALTTIA